MSTLPNSRPFVLTKTGLLKSFSVFCACALTTHTCCFAGAPIAIISEAAPEAKRLNIEEIIKCDGANSFDISPDNMFLVCLPEYLQDNQSHAAVFELTHKKEIALLRFGTDALVAGKFSIDSKRLLVTTEGSAIHSFTSPNFKTEFALRYDSAVPTMIATPKDNKRFIIGDNHGQLSMLEYAAPHKLTTSNASDAIITQIELSGDGLFAAIAGASADVSLFDVSKAKTILTIPHGEKHTGMCALSPNGDYLAIANKTGLLQLWSTKTRSQLDHRTFADRLTGIRWSPDSKLLASTYSSGEVKLINIAHDTLVDVWASAQDTVSVGGPCFSSDGTYLYYLRYGVGIGRLNLNSK
jgi:WD40 repeat protein